MWLKATEDKQKEIEEHNEEIIEDQLVMVFITFY
jgi:hypothetical protein